EGPAPEVRPDVTPEEAGALAGAPAGTPAGEEQAPLPQGGKAMLKVATYNIHHGEGVDGRVDLERIAATLEELNADLIVLNEVDAWWPRSGRVDQASWLASRLNLPYYFYGANLQGRGDPSAPGPPAYGNLLLSRFPLLWAENRPLPRAGLSEPQGAIVAEVEVEGERLTVLGTHLGLSPQERYLQAVALRQLTGERLTDRRVLLGDLNAEATQPEVALLLADPSDPQAWVDVASRSPEPLLTFPSWAPRVRIDYILLSPILAERVQEVRVVRSEASDHLPLLAVLN
ncbi:MAG: endonuclease/exonuclease/phosphatase family protein, partial [Bacillota bacterium]|nr:endonuclease/exonuclease/phosphatase family protein [Bacillota bacterium]